MSAAPTPAEVLAFIDGCSSMPSGEWRARFPAWCKLMDRAHERFRSERSAYQAKWGGRASGSSDPMVHDMSSAEHQWVYLPLIREALAAESLRKADIGITISEAKPLKGLAGAAGFEPAYDGTKNRTDPLI